MLALALLAFVPLTPVQVAQKAQQAGAAAAESTAPAVHPRRRLAGSDDWGGALLKVRASGASVRATGYGLAGPLSPFSWDVAYHPGLEAHFSTHLFELYRFDALDGRARFVGAMGRSVSSLAYNPASGKLMGMTSGLEIVEIDPLTAELSVLPAGSQAYFPGLNELATDPTTGRIFGIGTISFIPAFAEFDPLSGAFTLQGYGAANAVCQGMAFDPNTGVCYGSAGQDLLVIDVETGLGTKVGTHGVPGFWSLQFHPLHGLLGLRGNGEILAIDTVTAEARPFGALGFGRVEGLAVDPSTGTVYGVSDDVLLWIDRDDAHGTVIGAHGFADVRALAFDTVRQRLLSVDLVANALVAIDPGSGTGVPIGPLGPLGAGGVEGLAFDPAADLVYGAVPATGEVVTIDAASGQALARVSTGVVGLAGLGYDVASGTLYGGEDAAIGHVLTIDPATGQSVQIGLAGPRLRGLAFDPVSGGILATDSDPDLLEVDPQTGAGSTVGALGFSFVEGLAYDPVAGWIYAADDLTDHLVRVDPFTGRGTAVGPMNFDQVTALAYDPTQQVLYGIDAVTDQLLVLDSATGAGSALFALGGGADFRGLTFDVQSGLLYGSDVTSDQLFVIPTVSGAPVPVGTLGHGMVEGLAFDPVSRTLHGVDSSGMKLLEVDPGTGAATEVGATRRPLRGLAPLYP